jgi:hypothetical protein
MAEAERQFALKPRPRCRGLTFFSFRMNLCKHNRKESIAVRNTLAAILLKENKNLPEFRLVAISVDCAGVRSNPERSQGGDVDLRC